MLDIKIFIFCLLLFGCSAQDGKDGDITTQPDTMEIKTVQISVDTDKTIASNVNNKLGMNLNAGLDNDINRAPGAGSLSDALKELGTKHLRFPGGKKSLYYVWSEAPYDNTNTAHWLADMYYDDVAVNTMNFDEFMIVCNEVGAQAHINVAYNPPAGLDERLAAEWVRYANITNNYNIKYWEIGNEMWQQELGLTTASLAEVVKVYSRAMKAVDPTIKIGVSWNQQQDIINATAGDLDFVTISNYLPWEENTKSYQSYAEGNQVALSTINSSLALKTVVSEYNSISWKDDAWDKLNVAGKGLMNFDLLGQLLKNEDCLYACYWNTRWFSDKGSIFDAFDDKNELLPAVQPLALWGMFIEKDLVEVTATSQRVVSYATHDSNTGNLVVFLINKGSSSLKANLNINSGFNYKSPSKIWQYKAVDENDTKPVVQNTDEVLVGNNKITELELPKTSITAIVLKPKG